MIKIESIIINIKKIWYTDVKINNTDENIWISAKNKFWEVIGCYINNIKNTTTHFEQRKNYNFSN